MSGQKSILNFFQKQTPTKRLLETTATSLTSSPSAALKESNKENEQADMIKVNSISFFIIQSIYVSHAFNYY